MEASLVRLSIIRVALMRFCYEIRNDYLPNNHFASQAVNLVFVTWSEDESLEISTYNELVARVFHGKFSPNTNAGE